MLHSTFVINEEIFAFSWDLSYHLARDLRFFISITTIQDLENKKSASLATIMSKCRVTTGVSHI